RSPSFTITPPPTRTLFPYTTLFRSSPDMAGVKATAMSQDSPTFSNAGHVSEAPKLSSPAVISIERTRSGASPWLVSVNVRAGERSEEHTSELQSRENLVCRLLLEKK